MHLANASYELNEGKLCIKEQPTQRTLYEGWVEGVPVMQVVELVNEDACLVLLDYYVARRPTFENLLKVGPNGKIIWRALLPQSHDCFCAIHLLAGQAYANTCGGFCLELDLSNGRAKDTRFTK